MSDALAGSRDPRDALVALLADLSRAATLEGLARELARWETVSSIDLVSVAVVHDDGLRFAHGASVVEDIAAEWPSAPLDAPIPMAEAVRTDAAVRLEPDRFGTYAGFVDEAHVLALASFEAHPVHGREAIRLVVGCGHRRAIDDDDRRTIDELVRVASQAVARIERHERDRAHGSMLAELLLPASLPVVDGLEVHGLYQAPSVGQRVGGDLHDVVVDDRGRVTLVVADAIGHDLQAARHLARVRHAIGSHALEGAGPARVLEVANRYLRRASSETFFSCLIVRLDPATGEIEAASAGHPPPVVVPPTGPVRLLEVPSAVLLGVLEPQTYPLHHTTLGLGETLVMFTDGVVERRGVPIDEGLSSMCDDLGRLEIREPVAITTALTRSDASDPAVDDVTVLVAKRTGRPVVDELVVRRPAAELDLAVVRAAVDRWCATQGLRSDDARLVVTELLQNARDANPVGDVEVRIRRRSDASIDIAVTNDGDGFVMPDTTPHTEPGRRGLAIAEAVSDALTIEVGSDRVTVRSVVSPVDR